MGGTIAGGRGQASLWGGQDAVLWGWRGTAGSLPFRMYTQVKLKRGLGLMKTPEGHRSFQLVQSESHRVTPTQGNPRPMVTHPA